LTALVWLQKILQSKLNQFIDKNTTVTVERTVARLMGVDGVDDIEKPLPNVLVDNIKEGGGLSRGVAFWLGNAMVNTGKTPYRK